MHPNSRDYWSTPQPVIDALSKDLGQEPILDLAADLDSAKAPYYVTPTILNINSVMNPQALRDGLFSLSQSGSPSLPQVAGVGLTRRIPEAT